MFNYIFFSKNDLIYYVDPNSALNSAPLPGKDNYITRNPKMINRGDSNVNSNFNNNEINRNSSSITNVPFIYSESYIAKYGTYDSLDQNNIESIFIECDTNLKDIRFKGSVGKIFKVKCPSCLSNKNTVFGSLIYHPYSSICMAASHAGSINPRFSGYVLVELVSGEKIYNGSIGVDKTLSISISSSDISFKTKPGIAPIKIKCTDTPGVAPFDTAVPGSKFVVICPRKCSKMKLDIYGSEVYADMSSICLSGIHYGVLSDKGGEIEFLIEGSQSYFKGTNSFGISSKSRESYIRSFRFVGGQSTTFYKFKEDFKGNINSKWNIFSLENAIYKKTNSWSYYDLKTNDQLLGKNSTQSSIQHKGIIKSYDSHYGTYAILKNVEWNNCRVRANFFFKDSKMAIFLFKYQDIDNYYAFEIDISNIKHNVKLIARIDGINKIIESKFITMKIETLYRMTLISKNDQISIQIQTDNIRENKPLFEHRLEQLRRGTIGFASNGNNDFYVSRIAVDDFIEHTSKKLNEKNRRSWVDLLRHTEPKSNKMYCTNLFGSKSNDIAKCLIPTNLCKYKCDEHIPTTENILNFNCYRDCLKKIANQNNQVKIEKKSWIPKVGEKIDFRPNEENSFLPGIVLDVKNSKYIKKGTVLLISYREKNGDTLKAKNYFPSNKILQCGSNLTERKDC